MNKLSWTIRGVDPSVLLSGWSVVKEREGVFSVVASWEATRSEEDGKRDGYLTVRTGSKTRNMNVVLKVDDDDSRNADNIVDDLYGAVLDGANDEKNRVWSVDWYRKGGNHPTKAYSKRYDTKDGDDEPTDTIMDGGKQNVITGLAATVARQGKEAFDAAKNAHEQLSEWQDKYFKLLSEHLEMKAALYVAVNNENGPMQEAAARVIEGIAPAAIAALVAKVGETTKPEDKPADKPAKNDKPADKPADSVIEAPPWDDAVGLLYDLAKGHPEAMTESHALTLVRALKVASESGKCGVDLSMPGMLALWGKA